MIGLRAQIAMAGLVMALGALQACGGEDDDDDANDSDAGTGGGDDDSGTGGGSSYTGVVVNSTNLAEKIPGITVHLFNPETGELYPGSQVSDANGMVTFPNRPMGAGTYAVGGMPTTWSDTWNFQPARKGEEQYIRMSSQLSATLVPNNAGYENDPKATAVAGSVLWHNDATNVDEFVGCATVVETEATKDIRYFDGNLPTSVENRPLALGTKPALPDGSNEPEAGKFFIANLAGGKQTVQIKIRNQGEVIGEREYFITPREEGSPLNINGTPTPSNVTLGSIWVEGAENPTPADCQ